MTASQTRQLLESYDHLIAAFVAVRADIARNFGPVEERLELRGQMDYVEDWRRALYTGGKDGREGPDGPVAPDDGWRVEE